MSLTNLTRRAFLASAAAGAATLLMARAAAAKPLEELTAENFSAKVYHNPKPVVVLFYEADTDLGNDGSIDFSRRMEQVVEALADKYDKQVAFFKVAMDRQVLRNGGSFTPQRKREYEQTFDVPGATPLTVMYGRFDVLSGRQVAHNFRIDTWNGGPVGDEWIGNWKKIGEGWINCNLTGSCASKDFAYRFENSAEIHKLYK